ncbi:bifunctional folylpolyglutamate synthase/dihydrofolate synthase [Sphingomonas sp.]|uniref:bifunctional folylpolyglutamate synthase/dihydrofolate synthase n=1 Tax=Sphingomonas sp. TaxID=28214 RepID=UPI0035BC5EA1
MADHATSSAPAVQAQLDRLWALSPGADILGLERITRLLARLGNPERRLPPVFHVAGTNGKGSTCAFLRAALEAAGHRVHVYSSPHLVRFNERIRLAGRLIDDDALAALLADVLDQADGIGASFFEVTTAAALLAFARTPADACVVEVGLGGRLDATNVLLRPAACGIAQLGVDHEAFLGSDPVGIAREKAGVAKPHAPLVTLAYDQAITAAVNDVATVAGAPVLALGRDWHIQHHASGSRYRDAHGTLDLPHPTLAGSHQVLNAGLAAAMLRYQTQVAVPDAALQAMPLAARWPARMQRLRDGPLTRRLSPEQRQFGVWLDGAHNLAAAQAIGDTWTNGVATAVVAGMLANKDAEGVIAELVDTSSACTFVGVPVPGHAHHAPEDLATLARDHGATAAYAARSIEDAFDLLARTGGGSSVLVAGSLYLAGLVLTANGELPD